MSFTSLLFIVFVAVVLLCYYIVQARFQWLVLLIASIVFICNMISGAVFLL